MQEKKKERDSRSKKDVHAAEKKYFFFLGACINFRHKQQYHHCTSRHELFLSVLRVTAELVLQQPTKTRCGFVLPPDAPSFHGRRTGRDPLHGRQGWAFLHV